jgi:hypothetical protein
VKFPGIGQKDTEPTKQVSKRRGKGRKTQEDEE